MQFLCRILFPLVLVVLILSACSYNPWLDWHNVYRCMHGAPALEWSSTLAAVAAWRAKNCKDCSHCVCPQSDTSCYSIYKQNYAENATCWAASPKEAVDAWYSEIKNYDYNNPQWNNNTGHFINVVVNTATKVGCACNTDQCYCDYDSNYGTTPQALSQVVLKPVKTYAQCTTPAP